MNPCSIPAQPTNPPWLAALQIAVILASIALSLFPQVRLPAVLATLDAASFANCAIMLWREWKTGRLSMTPGQLFQMAKAGERFPRQSLGMAAVVASTIAQWPL